MNNNRYPYPPSEALQPPGVSTNNPQSYNANRPPHNMSANAANASTLRGNHPSSWNNSQMFFPPTLPRPDNFQGGQPRPQFNQPEPPPPIPGFGPPPGLHPPPGAGLNQPTGFHPPPGSGLTQPSRHPPPPPHHPPSFHPPPSSDLTRPPGWHPSQAGLHPPPGSGLPQPTRHPPPTGFHPPPGSGFAPPTHPPPQTGIHPGSGLAPPTGFLSPPTGLHQSSSSGLMQPTRPPDPSSFHPPTGAILNQQPGFHPPPIGHQPPPPPGSGLFQPPRPPTPTGVHPPPGSGLAQPPRPPPPAGIQPPLGSGLAPPTGHHPPAGFHSPQGPGVAPPAGFHQPPGSGLSQPPPVGPHSFPTPGPGPHFPRPHLGPEVSGRASNFFREREKFVEPAVKPPQPEDEMMVQRKLDCRWVKQFLENKGKVIRKDPKPLPDEIAISDMKNNMYSTAQLLFQLSTLCENLKLNIDNPREWSDSYKKALIMKQKIHSQLKALSDHELLEKMKTKLSNIAKKRARQRRAREQMRMEEEEREVQKAEKEAAIERWRMKKIHAEEEKKKERELKVAADAVLCDVRKKLTDVKRTQNILKSLEKLRKLRKEAASRKGIHTDPQSDASFSSLLEELREVAKKWTAVYAAEEKVLMVMLEGEQEEERKRDLEKRRQKERDKLLRRKRKVQAMLFGDDTPADPLMQPFRQYYTQAEHSLPALVQIRREWDVFLVPVDHPEGSAVPQGWVLPDAPSDQAWASALQSSECEDG